MSVSFSLKRQIVWFKRGNVESCTALQMSLRGLSPAETVEVQKLLVHLENKSRAICALTVVGSAAVVIVSNGGLFWVSFGASVAGVLIHSGNMEKYEAIQRMIETSTASGQVNTKD